MAAPQQTTCGDWCDYSDVILCGDSRYAELDPYNVEDQIPIASDLLWRMSGPGGASYTGECEATVRPCANRASIVNSPMWERAGAAGFSTFAWGAAGGWWWGYDSSWGMCGCGTGELGASCGCSGLSQIRLGPVPIIDITEVVVNGTVVPDTDYRIDEFQWLVRLPDAGTTTPRYWPCCSRLDLPLSADNTFGVTFTYGTLPPPSGVEAAAVLAGELALARCGGDCNLPESVQRQSRENVDFVVISPDPTGISLWPDAVKRWLRAVNPNDLRSLPSVWSPEIGRSTRMVDT